MDKLTCPCGAVEITVRGTPVAQFYCHCGDCRTMTSGRAGYLSHPRVICAICAEREGAPKRVIGRHKGVPHPEPRPGVRH